MRALLTECQPGGGVFYSLNIISVMSLSCVYWCILYSTSVNSNGLAVWEVSRDIDLRECIKR